MLVAGHSVQSSCLNAGLALQLDSKLQVGDAQAGPTLLSDLAASRQSKRAEHALEQAQTQKRLSLAVHTEHT